MVASEIVVMTPGMGDSSIYASSPTRPASWLANTPEVAPACWGGGGRLFPTLLQSPPSRGGDITLCRPPPSWLLHALPFPAAATRMDPAFRIVSPPFFGGLSGSFQTVQSRHAPQRIRKFQALSRN